MRLLMRNNIISLVHQLAPMATPQVRLFSSSTLKSLRQNNIWALLVHLGLKQGPETELPLGCAFRNCMNSVTNKRSTYNHSTRLG